MKEDVSVKRFVCRAFGVTAMEILLLGGFVANAATTNGASVQSHSITFWNKQIVQYLHSLSEKTLSTLTEDTFQEKFVRFEEEKGLSRESIVSATDLGFFSHPGVPEVVVASVSETQTKIPEVQSQQVYTHSPKGWISESPKQVFGVNAAPGYQNIRLGIVNGKSALLSVTGTHNRVQLDLWENAQWKPTWYSTYYNATYVTLYSVDKFHLDGDSPKQMWALVDHGKSTGFVPVPYVSNEPYLYVTPLTIHAGQSFWITGWVPRYANIGREIEISWQSPKLGMSEPPWAVHTSANGTFRVRESFPRNTAPLTYTLSVLLDRTGTGMMLLESYENVVK